MKINNLKLLKELSEYPFSYVKSLNISAVEKFHLSAYAVPAVLYLSVHACHLLSLKTVHLSLQVFVERLLLFFLESQQK